MIEGLPVYVPVVFILTTLATIWFLLTAAKSVSRDSLSYKLLVFILPFWLLLTGFLAVLSFQGPMQRLAFDQPNIGVTFLPFIWLPTIIVPIVSFAHLASLYNSLRASRS